jgi:branched-chain amino acid transport system substrate-binding protein
VRHPPNNSDFASQLLQAQSSGARYIGLASVGADLVNLLKQAKEFGIGQDGKQSLVGFLVYITDIHSLGQQAPQGLTITSGFYRDQSETARSFSKRFFAKRGAMPSKDHAEIYTAVTHYLRAIEAVKSDDAVAVNRKLRTTPFDYFGTRASIRDDGRALYDLGLYKVEATSASRYPWDYYERIGTISQAEAFLPASPECLK